MVDVAVNKNSKAIWLHHTRTSYSPPGIRQGYKLDTNDYIVHADLEICLFSRLNPARTWERKKKILVMVHMLTYLTA